MAPTYINLSTDERALAQMASQIYSGYVSAERVPEGSEEMWMARCVDQAIRIAQMTNERVIGSGEIG